MVLTSLSNLGVVRLGELMRTVVYSLPLLSCFGFTYLTDRYIFLTCSSSAVFPCC